ncbi:MAG: hypothetical protein ACXADH_08530 [Candidatus Kariarchaeaceae archaeon]|jgi:hypothetical protein
MDKDIKELNSTNEWLRFLQTGEVGVPYLKEKNKRATRKPKYVSAKQRRIYKTSRGVTDGN